jgi:cytochrome c553
MRRPPSRPRAGGLRTALLGAALLACAAGHALAADRSAAGDAARGKELSGECSVCHDGDGRTRLDLYPRIAGQTYQYLFQSMKEFRTKERSQAYASLMWPSVAQLTDQDLRDLAAYYSRLPW